VQVNNAGRFSLLAGKVTERPSKIEGARDYLCQGIAVEKDALELEKPALELNDFVSAT